MAVERETLNKVPEVTVYFWIIKVLSTAMGETTSDFLIHRVGLTNKPGLVAVVLVTGLALAGALVLQFTVRRYVPWIYWLAVALVGIFGTLAADGVHVEFGVPYLVSSIFFGVALAAVFAAWYAFEKTLSIHTIVTRRREFFYWTVVMTTFALGTAVGDMTAFTLHLGFFSSGLLFAAAIAIPALAYRLLGLNAVSAFWFAYILTRPLGASFADWVAASYRGGLGVGFGVVSLTLASVIAVLVAYLTVTKKDVGESGRAQASVRT